VSEFENRVILISGASGSLGSAATEAFLRTGAIVAGVARAWKGRALQHERFSAIDADLTTLEGARTAVATAFDQRKQLDAVIHVMGGFAGGKPVEETEDATWEHMMRLNARSAFYVFREALPLLRARGRGRVVAVGSRAGEEPARSAGWPAARSTP
jgi:NAD(P)-dependent dehydrogenase (short-subunit alcohol dehydrogenase family)